MRTRKILTANGKKPRVERERGMQVALFQWAKLQECVEPRLKLLFAIPNGGARPVIVTKQGKRFSVTAARMKAEGVKSGVPDICLPVAVREVMGEPGFTHVRTWPSLWIELKAEKNRPSPEQEQWLAALRAQGCAVFVVWDDWEQAKGIIEQYLRGEIGRLVSGSPASGALMEERIRSHNGRPIICQSDLRQIGKGPR